ncbi:MAG: hypothetical protein HYX60_03345, partial [Legionella longbeachae]|nr:hypothetical protein [Legionella longbeachae]
KIHSLTPLSHHLCTQRYTQVIIGAPPTGKSWLMKNTLQDFNLHLSDFANISPDKFRLHLLGHPSLGEDRSIHGTLTHGESCVITQESIRHLYEILQENQQAPHVFLEQMNAGRDAIHLGLFRGSKLRISVTHYPIEKAIHGNHERFIRTQKRKVPLQSILNAFKSVSETIPEVLTNNSGQDIVYYLYDIDELIHRKLAKSEVLIARIDCQSQTIIIKNIPGFIQFYKNAFMNINAKGSSELYDSLNLSDTLVIDAILEKFQSITFIFSKPDVHNINAEVLLENEYARYSQAEGMTIKNIDVFEEVKEDIVSQKLFERFELHSFVGHLRAWNK